MNEKSIFGILFGNKYFQLFTLNFLHNPNNQIESQCKIVIKRVNDLPSPRFTT
jgi:hypothetical protein